MTKNQCLKKVDELSDKTAEAIREKARTLLKTGCINLSEWEDNYLLPKIMLHALCKEMAFQWKPLSEQGREAAKNMEYFIQ